MNEAEIKEAVRKSWDRSSTMYDRTPGHRIGTVEEKAAWKQELSRDIPSPPQRVLDVGCGTGAMGLLFAEMGHQVTGIDLSVEMMAKARKKAEENGLEFELRTGDAENLPFEDSSFDVIVNRHLLWTLPNPEVALKDWYRVLNTGGVVLIIDGVWNDKSLPTRAKIWTSNVLTRIFEPEDTHHKSYDRALREQLPHDGGVPKETMLSYLDRAGFARMQFRDLMYIREIQKPELPWYRRISPGKSYYILVGKKQERSD